MSRKNVVSAASSSASPAVNTSWMSDDDGEPEEIREIRRVLEVEQEAHEDRQAQRKCTMFDSTLTSGSTSAGNITLRIRFAPATSDAEPSLSDEENQVHGRMPQNRNSPYGSMSADRFGRNVAKTTE